MLEAIVYGLETGAIDIRDTDLTGLDIDPKTAEAVQALKENRIKNLKLFHNLGLHDILHLSKALATNTSLESLDLSYNNLDANSCLALGRALEHNSTLKKLDISRNRQVDTMAVEYFLLGAQRNIGLRELHLNGSGICSSSCIQRVIELMPRLISLYSNIFATRSGLANADTDNIMYNAAKNGLFNAIKSHYALCNLFLGHLCISVGSDVIEAVVRRNKSTPNTIHQWADNILTLGIHEKGFSEATLKAAYKFPKFALAISDLVLLNKGYSHSVRTGFENPNMSTENANVLFREVKALSLCIYVRDVVLKDATDADKFGRFCTVMYLHNSEKNSASGVNTTELERAAQSYYRSAPDAFEADIDQAITRSTTSLEKWKERRMREVQALEEDNNFAGWGHF